MLYLTRRLFPWRKQTTTACLDRALASKVQQEQGWTESYSPVYHSGGSWKCINTPSIPSSELLFSSHQHQLYTLISATLHYITAYCTSLHYSTQSRTYWTTLQTNFPFESQISTYSTMSKQPNKTEWTQDAKARIMSSEVWHLYYFLLKHSFINA